MLDELDDLDRPPVIDAARIDALLDRLRGRPATRVQAARVQAAAAQPRPVTRAEAARPERIAPPRQPGGRSPHWRAQSAFAALVLIAAVWAATGFFKVQPDQVGVVLRFGRLVDTRGPGLNYHWPYPIETALLPKVTEVNQLRIGNGAITQMLTGDENIVEATAAVFWRVKDPVKYLFNVNDPEGTVRVAAEGAVRQVIGLNPIQAALSDQRQKIADDAQKLLQHLLDSYGTGIEVTQVELQRVDPPTAVIDAFNDVQRARADQERARNEAEAYRNDILPRARGDAERIRQEANAYREQAVNQARGEAERFAALDATYRQAREVTARRLYLETMEEVLRSANKVVLDPTGSGAATGVVPVLPLGVPNRPATLAAGPRVGP